MNPSVNMFLTTTNFYDNTVQSINSQMASSLIFNNPWLLFIFIMSLIGILITLIILFLFIYFSNHRLVNHLILPNLFICFSVCFIYLSILIFSLYGNELVCSLREFLSQISYVLLYSSFLCRYIMEWLATRILSTKTKHIISSLIYILLVTIQIPIGILWWYFTKPHFCQQKIINERPKLIFNFHQQILFSTLRNYQPCSYQCIVDYRSYATYTYIIFQFFLCTIIATSLFLYRCCHPQSKIEKPQLMKMNRHRILLTFLNMFAFILINITWLSWTFIYYFTDPFFVYPSHIITMFVIGTICLLVILVPQIFFNSKMNFNSIDLSKTIIFTNKLVSKDDRYDQDLLLNENLNRNKNQTTSNESDVSYELGTSGTFLPITRTPRGAFQDIHIEKETRKDKLDRLNCDQHSYNIDSIHDEQKQNLTNSDSINHRAQSSEAPLQRQHTSNSITSDFVDSILITDDVDQSNPNIRPSSSSLFYSSYNPSHHDETIIPILCSTQRQHTSTPVKMRILVKSLSSTVPTTRRIQSGNDHRYIDHPYSNILPSPSTPVTPLYNLPVEEHKYLFIDPYRPQASYSSSHLLTKNSNSSQYFPSLYRRYPIDNRSLAQRLWDIDSCDDEDDIDEDIINIHKCLTPTNERLKDVQSSPTEIDADTILHIDDDDNDDNEDNQTENKCDK